MFEFKILKLSGKSRARLGVISTPHGEIETPAFIPVATRATVRTLSQDEVEAVGSQALICNTYHLKIAPGDKLIHKSGGLHTFMQWKKPNERKVEKDMQPVNTRISDDGVHFLSPIDGEKMFLGPKESIRIQENLGADIMYAFDECISPLANKEYMQLSLEKTHRWARQCLDAKHSNKQALYGIVQGGSHRDLREESARVIGAMEFDGFGIGGEYGYDKRVMSKLMGWV